MELDALLKDGRQAQSIHRTRVTGRIAAFEQNCLGKHQGFFFFIHDATLQDCLLWNYGVWRKLIAEPRQDVRHHQRDFCK